MVQLDNHRGSAIFKLQGPRPRMQSRTRNRYWIDRIVLQTVVFQTDRTQKLTLERPDRLLPSSVRQNRRWPPLGTLKRLCPDNQSDQTDPSPDHSPDH